MFGTSHAWAMLRMSREKKERCGLPREVRIPPARFRIPREDVNVDTVFSSPRPYMTYS